MMEDRRSVVETRGAAISSVGHDGKAVHSGFDSRDSFRSGRLTAINALDFSTKSEWDGSTGRIDTDISRSPSILSSKHNGNGNPELYCCNG
jgi:hypothetical protein